MIHLIHRMTFGLSRFFDNFCFLLKQIVQRLEKREREKKEKRKREKKMKKERIKRERRDHNRGTKKEAKNFLIL